MALLSGAWIAVGVASAVSGRMIFNPRRFDWSPREVEMLAAITVIQGLAFAIYTLAGGLFLTGAVTPPWVGHAWGILIGTPLYLFVMATIGFQTYLGNRHQARMKRSARQESKD